MIFNLEIYQNDGTQTGKLIGSHQSVDIQWAAYGQTGQCVTASCNGTIIVCMPTFDDYPIEIETGRIVIQGIAVPGSLDNEYGYWSLTRSL